MTRVSALVRVEHAPLVADGAAMRHLADDVGVAYGMQTIGSDHIAIEIYAHMLVRVIVLGKGNIAAHHEGQYEKQLFQSLRFGDYREIY